MKLIAIIFLLLALPVHAWDWEGGIGRAESGMPPDSQYVQGPFPHSFDLISPVYYIGGVKTTSHSPKWFNALSNGASWRVGFIDLGTVKGQAHATSDDANYSGIGGGCHDMSRCRPEDLSVWYTHSRTRGIEASVSPEWTDGSYKIGFKLGVLAHFPTVKVRIWRDDADPARKAYDYKTRVNFGPTAGVNVAYKNATVSLSCYKINAGSRGEDDPTNDADPVNIPQNSSSDWCGTVVLLGTIRF